jgi:hypothetical protein
MTASSCRQYISNCTGTQCWTHITFSPRVSWSCQWTHLCILDTCHSFTKIKYSLLQNLPKLTFSAQSSFNYFFESNDKSHLSHLKSGQSCQSCQTIFATEKHFTEDCGKMSYWRGSSTLKGDFLRVCFCNNGVDSLWNGCCG